MHADEAIHAIELEEAGGEPFADGLGMGTVQASVVRDTDPGGRVTGIIPHDGRTPFSLRISSKETKDDLARIHGLCLTTHANTSHGSLSSLIRRRQQGFEFIRTLPRDDAAMHTPPFN